MLKESVLWKPIKSDRKFRSLQRSGIKTCREPVTVFMLWENNSTHSTNRCISFQSCEQWVVGMSKHRCLGKSDRSSSNLVELVNFSAKILHCSGAKPGLFKHCLWIFIIWSRNCSTAIISPDPGHTRFASSLTGEHHNVDPTWSELYSAARSVIPLSMDLFKDSVL